MVKYILLILSGLVFICWFEKVSVMLWLSMEKTESVNVVQISVKIVYTHCSPIPLEKACNHLFFCSLTRKFPIKARKP